MGNDRQHKTRAIYMEQRADKSSELDPLPRAFNFDDRFHMMGEAGEGSSKHY